MGAGLTRDQPSPVCLRDSLKPQTSFAGGWGFSLSRSRSSSAEPFSSALACSSAARQPCPTGPARRMLGSLGWLARCPGTFLLGTSSVRAGDPAEEDQEHDQCAKQNVNRGSCVLLRQLLRVRRHRCHSCFMGWRRSPWCRNAPCAVISLLDLAHCAPHSPQRASRSRRSCSSSLRATFTGCSSAISTVALHQRASKGALI